MTRVKDEEELIAAKRGYKEAARDGNHEEEARWANVLGDIYKRRGEYIQALTWLRKDYDVSVKHLPCKQLLPTCQSLGEVYFCLERFKDALVYQKKHLELAKDSDDLVEQQRASTQLGRSYHEMFLRSENDHHAIRNAKKYFKSAMKLAGKLKEDALCKRSTVFLKEFIDAHNNIGLLELDLDNLEEAENFLLQGLKICDDEEVPENDDARSRLHHNLGKLYLELRDWGKARVHIEEDIMICKRIGHTLGESKGFINLGELNYRTQKYDEAIRCYQKALDIAKLMEDEDALVTQINQNIRTVKEAAQVLNELQRDEQELKKLIRSTGRARGTSSERKCLLEQKTCLDSLIEKSSIISVWPKHLEFAKRIKKVASELCDKEKLSDAYLAIGESYQKLRNFSKARKWYMKSWSIYRSIGNLEGQALVKINIGEVLDSCGNWIGALEAFEEGYRLAVEGKLLCAQLSALENMHYSHMIRFDHLDDARKLQHDIQKLRQLLKDTDGLRNQESDYCSETDTEGGEQSVDFSERCGSPYRHKASTSKVYLSTCVEDIDVNVPLASLKDKSKKDSSKAKKSQLDSCAKKTNDSCCMPEPTIRYTSQSNDNQQAAGRKRLRVIVSDDETDEPVELDEPKRTAHESPVRNVAASDFDNKLDETTAANVVQADHSAASKDVLSSSMPVHIEESACSFKSKKSNSNADESVEFGSSTGAGLANSGRFVASGFKSESGCASGYLLSNQNCAGFNLPEHESDQFVAFKIGDEAIRLNVSSFIDGDTLDIESLKLEIACVYFLQLSEEKRSKGWVPKRLMKLYIDNCQKVHEIPNMKLLKKLYNLEISEDEILISDCGLQDLSISPFLTALQVHRTVAVLDISHNLLGNETMERLKQIFALSSQTYGGLTVDLHSNGFGPTALFQICECPVMLSRLEVLNLSQNRLTDACGSYLCTILENCKALYSLNLEACSVTSRTVQKIADTLHEGLVLSHLSLGKNYPISGNAMASLLAKLASLRRFSELSLVGIRLNKIMVDGLCQLARTSSFSALLLGGTQIGVEGSIQIAEALCSGPQELVKLDLSCCGLTAQGLAQICASIASIGGVIELNLDGNSIGREGCDAVGAILMDQQCRLRRLTLNKCHLGVSGVVQIVQALSGNDSLEELHLADNASIPSERTMQFIDSTLACPKSDAANAAPEICKMNAESDGLEVADSEDEDMKGPASSGQDGSCASSCQKNTFTCCQLIQDLSSAISLATQLQLLDLSKNRFSSEAIDAMYASWSSSGSRSSGQALKHVTKDQTVHFSTEGKRCCGIKQCCRKD
ncbi:hypothetical protein J5N97_002115 [Dioscorea zingiberensis]|uniref:Protein TONSOKU n=1 Tax=Dioscorea zingiberensis TaxID=325984 RepID=A0A9D5D348_9LILI|nr:hypothetical protein J5N97_002115 [Dioscorea zingiberensis]